MYDCLKNILGLRLGESGGGRDDGDGNDDGEG